MALILTFIGNSRLECTTAAIAAAKKCTAAGQRVLLASQDTGPTLGLLLGGALGADAEPATVDGFKVVQLCATTLLQKSWEQVKQLEAQFVRTPFFKDVYGEELSILPGMDRALGLNALREYDASGEFDVIVYDGGGDQATLRMLGLPEVLSWYIRRFRQVFLDSDLGKTVSPFIQPISSAVLTVNWSSDNFSEPTNQANAMLDEGKAALANPQRVAAYVVTTANPVAIAGAKYLWGSAQQVGLTVVGVLGYQVDSADAIADAFAPLPINPLPAYTGDDWSPLVNAMPDFQQPSQAPRPITISVAERTVKLFLPGFDKKQVKLTQYGPEITIDAGDQRRNIFLPTELRGQPVKGAKFQDGYLIIAF